MRKPRKQTWSNEMAGRIICLPIFFRLPGLRKVQAIALWPFIFIRDARSQSDRVLLRHEAIHLRQQLELCVIPFYLIYLGEFLWHMVRGKNGHMAYRSISFEREAYRFETVEGYLQDRPLFASFRLGKSGM